ncbi:response regulator transcription factor [Allosalinactinospora lopnorensis]|uniref:response regulator transcription factor n=1 Tax=Allosalinactinospora lopnorensis TaxID=1352348 RepID=UPI000695FB44|nr:response regulator transcription factor [Allosalinactinospora lopnorensis]
MESSVVILHQDEVIRSGLETIIDRIPQVSHSKSYSDWSAVAPVLRSFTAGSIWIVSHTVVRQDPDRVPMLQSRGMKVILLLHGADGREITDAADLSPDGFLSAGDVSRAVLLETIRALRQGRILMSPELTRGLLTELRRPGKAGANLLTPRETQTLKLLVEGCSNKQIAKHLGIGINSVKRHVGNILAKLNCPNRTMAAAEAVRLKII